ncbi:chaperone modulatory protein CbpM [Serratia fonticola]|jgi:chaperone modulatory protein CbpM|uniref:Chaperone modulatory protein CbpM n=1 Tax=Serratia fonticola TaxID=47917 RepID=A0A542BQY3_SERFO|nr:chaperone modulator CbpM [Serratia fonticola]TQI80994.1 chaperone modulatory protein CbpM [Serratia fonticola]TQI96982.1 chaperone modulatory protein CbpM [Serratia fonticola]TVZ71477.1 chaperone modulatory protein CbpM [Serratia fonticola]
MTKLQITLTITEFCLHTGVTEAELMEVVGLGVIQPRDPNADNWLFDDGALAVFNRAQRLQRELALDWPGIAVALTLLEEIDQLRKENSQLRHRLDRFITL